MVVATDKTIDEHIREELSDFPESEEKEDAISLAIQMVENENYTVGEAASEVSIELKQSLEKSNQLNIEKDKHKYMMLSRLKSDCLYFLGNGCGSEKHLWALAVENQILEMKKLWNEIVVKPEWLTLEEIDDFKKQMCILKLEIEKDNPDFINQNNIHFYYEFMGDDDIRKSSCEAEEFVKSLATPSREISLKIIDIDYDEGLDFDDVLSQIPMITTDNAVVTDGQIIRYTAILSNAKSLSVFYDTATGEYAYNGNGLTKLENDICEDIGTELQNTNGNYEDIIKKLTAVAVDLVPNNSVLDEFKDDFINPVVDKESANRLIASICWDNWEDEDEDNKPTGKYYKVESVLWNRVGALIENEDDGTDEDSEFDDVKEQIELYFKAIGENGIIKQSSSLKDLHDYFEKITIQLPEVKEGSVEDYAQHYSSDKHGNIENLLASKTSLQALEQ